MQHPTTDKNFEALFTLYNQEMDLLKEKLLNGESWENLNSTRKNITELAIALHKSHSYIVSNTFKTGNPAEFPQLDESSASPVE
jgi:hypothetical protein